MKGMVFAAGLGSRLLPLTANRPKALVELNGVAMLERVLLHMKQCGVTEAVVNVHHFADMVCGFLHDNHNFGMHLHISDETPQLLDTGGALVAARRWLNGDEPILLHNADIITNADLGDIERRHTATSADATLMVAQRPSSRLLLFDDDMQMHGWADMRSGTVRPANLDTSGLTPLAFGGVHIVSPRLLSDLCLYAGSLPTPVFSIIDYYIAACSRMRLRGLLQPSGTIWHDIGTVEKLHKAEAELISHPTQC